MNTISWIVPPVIGAFTGYIANVIAIKMLFHPYKKILWIQGVIPKNIEKIANSIGETYKDLIDIEGAFERLRNEGWPQQLTDQIWDKLSWYKWIGFVFGLRGFIKGSIETLLNGFEDYLLNEDIIPEMISNKIKSLDMSIIEKKILSVARNEIMAVRFYDTVLGFIIGLTQILIMMYIK